MAQTTYSGNPFTSYSSFFSSGLLSQHTPRPQRRGTFNSDISEPWDTDVSRPSSPFSLPEDSVMDIDMSDFASTSNTRRSTTPTPQSPTAPKEQTTPIQASKSHSATHSPAQSTSTQQQPRLRRRRSSLTQATSPMNVIRSPSRSAGNALHLQMQLPARSRSGSVGDGALDVYGGAAIGMATEGTSLVGRMRSGSCSSVHSLPGSASVGPNATVASRSRRLVRRIPTTAMPALRAPPPTMPLPALPLPSPLPSGPDHFSRQQKLRPSNLNLKPTTQIYSNGLKSPTLKSPTLTSARARGLSVSNSALDGDENKIDEEMKEN